MRRSTATQMQNKKLNRFVVEVQNGTVLFLNRATPAADGWWWGSDADPLQRGPFASSEEAVVDARRDLDGGFKLVRWDSAELQGEDRPLPPRGHIVVVDTGGRLWVRTGERPVRDGWAPRQ